MPTATQTSVSEYLSTSYRPDREFLDGIISERNVGEFDHSRLQSLLTIYLGMREKQWGILVLTEQRVQVKPTRFRIPDVCVVIGPHTGEQILTKPPFLCIEILSKDDRVSEMQERIDDHLDFGVHQVWVFDPRKQRAFIFTKGGMTEPTDQILRADKITVPLDELFA